MHCPLEMPAASMPRPHAGQLGIQAISLEIYHVAIKQVGFLSLAYCLS